MWSRIRCVLVLSLLVASGGVLQGRQTVPLFSESMLHAHNCYPEDNRWADRIERALGTTRRPVAIEQDVVWAVDAAGHGRSVVSHGAPLSGTEPTLEAHFFERVAPLMRDALLAPRRDQWPLVVLHLDFKTNEPAHHRAIWALLGKYEAWLTTAPKAASGAVQPFRVGPLLVLTENGEGQAAVFNDAVPDGGRLRLFGTVPPVRVTTSDDREAQYEAAVRATPEALMPAGATNYRRWVNFSWAVVERGGQARAGEWDTNDRIRLGALVARAHQLGLWVRFYTLNGHASDEGRGWTASYNFGSLAQVEPRWRAVMAAGVEFVATDQYEAFARVLTDRRATR